MYKKGLISMIILVNIFALYNLGTFLFNHYLDQNIQSGGNTTKVKTDEIILFKDLRDSMFVPKREDEILKKEIYSGATLESIYNELSTLRSVNTLTSGECHEISHYIGKYFYLREKSLEEIFSKKVYDYIGDINCANGFYHGALIGYTSISKNSSSLYNNLSEIVKNYEEKIYNKDTTVQNKNIYIDMVHGVGHALYLKSFDVERASNECEKISENLEIQDVCKSGAFMEESFQERAYNIPSSILKCIDVEEKNKYACYTGNRSSDDFLKNNVGNLVKSCQSLEEDYFAYACYKSLFFQLAYLQEFKKISTLATLCNGALDKQNICLETLHKITLRPNVGGLKTRIFLCGKVASKENFLNFFSCYKYLKQRNKMEMVFMQPTIKI